ncbi:alpha/beta hydrolase [Patescibacteria group bacterium]
MKVQITTSDNFILDGVFKQVKGSPKGIIFAHGMTVDKDDEGIFVKAEPKLNKLGFSTLRFDFRAHGKSQGDSVKDFTISGELKDLDAVFDYLESKGMEEIGLAGASVGGGISALYAGIHPKRIKALFLANPALDYEKCFLKPTTSWAKEHFQNIFKRLNKKGFIEIGSRKFRVGRRLFEEMKQYSPCEELKKYLDPLLIVHGDKDSKVAYQDVVDCFNRLTSSQKNLATIRGSEHGFHEEPYESQVANMIVEFFKLLPIHLSQP